MDRSKDYYTILGVLLTAEDIVIRAAYKALAKRYHPDAYTGSKEEADERMAELNEAYAVLSDAVKRKEYDKLRGDSNKTGSYTEEPEQEVGPDPLEKDWAVALKYYPEIDAPRLRLNKISHTLEFTYRAVLLEGKAFDKAKELASKMERQFLELYFGTNSKIVDFAIELILSGHKDAAKELNEAVRVLGKAANPDKIIPPIQACYGILSVEEKKKVEAIENLLNELHTAGGELYYYNKLIELMDGRSSIFRNVFFKRTFEVSFNGKAYSFDTKDKFVSWVKSAVLPKAKDYLKRMTP